MPADSARRALAHVVNEARACGLCAPHLPLGPRPVLRASATARLLIVGQAPGIRVHETGVPWNDASGKRLREWLAVDEASFYDECRVAIVPIGLCYSGVLPKGGDKPPRPECAPTWHRRLRALMPQIELTLLVGSYAQAWYLGARRKATLTETVAGWREYLPAFVPMPHPSWRTTGWQRRNAWFDEDFLPAVRGRVTALL